MTKFNGRSKVAILRKISLETRKFQHPILHQNRLFGFSVLLLCKPRLPVSIHYECGELTEKRTFHTMLFLQTLSWITSCHAQEYKQLYVLSASQASQIYQLKFMASTSALDPNTPGQEVSYSILLAAQYGVSSKTIRDIWNRKTWIHATQPLFDQEQAGSSSAAYHEYLDRQVRICLD